jgi:hypothetical protein
VDVGKLLELAVSLGPGAGLGLSLGLLVFLAALFGGKVVMIGRFNDMKSQYERADREKQVAEKARDDMRYERDETRLMLVASLGQTRKNAQLATAMMIRSQHGDPDDGPRPAGIATG